MCIRNRLLSLLYKLFVVALSGYGLFLYSGLPGSFNLSVFKYFTILSNLLVFLFYIVISLYTAARLAARGMGGVSVFAPRLKGAVMMSITVTLLIYQFLLAPNNFVMPGTADALRNNIVHLYVPLAVLLDWLLFDLKGRFTAGDPFAWLGIPLLYFVYTVLAAMLGVTYVNDSRYPYYFINADELGWGRVALNVALLCLFVLVLGYVLDGIDKLLGAFARKPAEATGIAGRRGATVNRRERQPAGRRVYKAGDAATMPPADSVVETPPVDVVEKDVIIVEKEPAAPLQDTHRNKD